MQSCCVVLVYVGGRGVMIIQFHTARLYASLESMHQLYPTNLVSVLQSQKDLPNQLIV